MLDDAPSYPVCRNPTCRTTKRPGYADRGLCPPHEAAGLDAIGALPGNAVDLSPLIWEKLRIGGLAAVGAPFGPTEPMNLTVDALVLEIWYALEQWAEIVGDRVGLADADFYAAGRLVAHYTALMCVPPWPVARYDRRITDMDGLDAILWMTDLHRRAVWHVGNRGQTKNVPGACVGCGHERLQHRNGADTVWCAHCRAVMTWDAYVDAIELVPIAA
jgi:hypothetical protein